VAILSILRAHPSKGLSENAIRASRFGSPKTWSVLRGRHTCVARLKCFNVFSEKRAQLAGRKAGLANSLLVYWVEKRIDLLPSYCGSQDEVSRRISDRDTVGILIDCSCG
jgi:hypothetical protein